MSLTDIRRILAVRDEGAAPCGHVLALVERNLAAVWNQITELERLRADPRRFHRLLREKVPQDAATADDCPCFALLHQFEATPRAPPVGAEAVRDKARNAAVIRVS